MRFAAKFFVIFIPFALGTPRLCAQQVDKEIADLLDQAEKATHKEKQRLLHKIVKLLPNRNRLEDKGITRRFAILLKSASPEEVRMLLGNPTLIVRQIVYRRYREQWFYDAPLRLLVVVEAKQGYPPTIQTVQARSRMKS